MKTTECERCREMNFDCECDANNTWYSFEEYPPEEGQLCYIKMVTTLKAYYVPECKKMKWVTPDEKQIAKQVCTSWKPVKKAKKVRKLKEDGKFFYD